jgi:hypothetical protein
LKAKALCEVFSLLFIAPGKGSADFFGRTLLPKPQRNICVARKNVQPKLRKILFDSFALFGGTNLSLVLRDKK